MNSVQWVMKSKVGALYLIASSKGLHGLFWQKQNVPMVKSLNTNEKGVKILAETVRQLEEYFVGKRKNFRLPVDVTGTEFQRRVWAELSKIPYGETRSYKDIACALKNEKAVRAVGTANGRNPISIVVPCHRVIGANGTLAGFAGGLTTKAKLLEHEKRSALKA